TPMASARPWPFDDEDRPSGSVRPLSQADLQAILAHLGDDPAQLPAGTIGDRPVVAVRVRASVGRLGGSAQATWPRVRAAAGAGWSPARPPGGPPHPRRRHRRRATWQPADTEAGAGPWRAGGHGGRLGAAIPTQPR